MLLILDEHEFRYERLCCVLEVVVKVVLTMTNINRVKHIYLVRKRRRTSR